MQVSRSFGWQTVDRKAVREFNGTASRVVLRAIIGADMYTFCNR